MQDFLEFFKRPTDGTDFDAIRIGIASPQKIREWSFGEVKKSETINYRTFKPERDGLFCAKIFGPVKDWECLCGKYKRIRHRGVVCEKCGVEVTQAKVRRERMGHIELACPVSHIWFFKGLPSRIGQLLDMPVKKLETILYFENYVVLDPGETDLDQKQLLTEEQYRSLSEDPAYGGRFKAGIGAEAIRELLRKIDIEVLANELREQLKVETSIQKKKKLTKRLKVVEAFRKSECAPGNMILEVIPVIPPELRPLVPLDGGRFATSDLNDLYRRVINRNNRLKRLQELKAPEVIIRNEKRMLQESVDALFDNGRRGRVLRGSKNRPLKSLSDMLKGKQGRFRQNLLGKRVDYSGRSVIVVGPELKLHQCGLPEKMAMELFKPFIFNRLQEKGFATTIKNAQKMVERETAEVWEVLEEVVKEHPVLLNRAPTLHRAGIQAFEPVLVGGKAIRIHPLVCAAFNADFDGDQMAVHVPLSIEAQVEAKILMMATSNLLSPANGSPLALPSQDMVLGIYYLTKDSVRKDTVQYYDTPSDSQIHSVSFSLRDLLPQDSDAPSLSSTNAGVVFAQQNGHVVAEDVTDGGAAKQSGLPAGAIIAEINGKPVHRLVDCCRASQPKAFASASEVIIAYNDKRVSLLEPIRLRLVSQRTSGDGTNENSAPQSRMIDTTVGRVIFNQMLPDDYPFINKQMDKKSLSRIITDIHLQYGNELTVEILDKLKELGFKYSTMSGLSIGIDDMQVPQRKLDLIQQAQEEVNQVYQQYNNGVITNGERYNKVIDIWSKVTEQVAEEMFRELEQSESGAPAIAQDDEVRRQLDYEISSRTTFNPIFMMADSGARGSRQQIRQLAGMRGLMAKPSGEIIETPITANFREGLSVLQYFISTHGARKGLADTALKTADSGYLTRRLVDVSQDVTVTEYDCQTLDGIYVTPIVEGGEVIESLRDRIIGRVALEDILHPVTEEVLVRTNELIDEELAENIENAGLDHVLIRSVLTCQSKRGVCALCYGSNLATRHLVNLGEAVGIIAAQSIGEPGTQLTMRTFHIGGTASAVTEQSTLIARRSGTVRFHNVDCVRNREQKLSVRSKGGVIGVIRDDNGMEDHYPPLVYGATLLVDEGDHVEADQEIARWDPFTTPIIVETSGQSTIVLRDVLEGITMREEVDEVTGLTTKVIIDTTNESYQPRFVLKDAEGKTVDQKLLPTGANLQVNDGNVVFAGDIIAKIPRDTTKTKDITGGLPRVVELFEARKPKEQATISEIDGVVQFGEVSRGMRKIVVRNENGDEREYSVPRGTHINVREGDPVTAGEPLMDGPSNPHDILRVLGAKEVQKYLVDEVQQVYRLQGVNINDKHIEVIVRQMLRRVKITDPGDTVFLMDEYIDRFIFEEENQRMIAEDGKPASGRPLLLGITVASLSTDSFISAASFQETTRVLTEAAISGKTDELRGLKENVIVGRLIPAGTGDVQYRRRPIQVIPSFDSLPA
ncbi:DNA-directed RNA polymerase subunit beta' [candidate division KSB3 bacterium]|uniref:DNA-directed RNA polymerase subunit beta' n=1 Tax=candidate division KSB3 bacterium TaxID=2044937 RepID=A0A9D5Q7K4_9BACT|nr:DNA-directed RNA polymerase subunit beta' [candidate division KSB3 bacterium]MBD3326985.1 DNA-directed RNA polymerase subunit beta' [candidate division KSB3 bacterium]